jgi:hypothetical protein
MQGAKPNNTLMAIGKLLSKFYGIAFEDPQLFQSIIGALQYVTITKPDISFTINRVSQYMHASTSSHWAAIKIILRYLKGTINHGMNITPSSSLTIVAYSDSDLVGCPDDRRSTTRYLVYLLVF